MRALPLDAKASAVYVLHPPTTLSLLRHPPYGGNKIAKKTGSAVINIAVLLCFCLAFSCDNSAMLLSTGILPWQH